MKKTIISLSIIAVMATMAVGATSSYFSDLETSAGNIFTAGTLDLKVGGSDPTQWSINVGDIKPGESDSDEAEIVNIGSIDGYLHITFANLVNDENSCVEPEEETANQSQENCEAEGGVWNGNSCDLSGDSSGELAKNLDVVVYLDNDDSGTLTDDDTFIYEGVVDSAILSLLQAKLIDLKLNSGDAEKFRIDWSVDGSVGNEVQSDKAGFDIPFELTQKSKTVLDGLVGWWTLNELGSTAYDYSGNGNDGTIYGAVLTNGKSGGALSFDGIDDYIKVSDDDVFNMDDYTIEMWVYNEAGDDSWPTLINRHSQTTGGPGFWWSYTTGTDESQINFQYTDGSGYHAVNWPNTLSKDSWTHIAFVFDESSEEVDLFINGASQGIKSTPNALPVTSGDIYFGEYQGSSSSRYSLLGNLDEIKIYNRILSSTEIHQNYQAGL